MAEFEELRLTVNLVDSASTGLQRIRAEIGQLTQSAQAMTAGMVSATAGLSNLAASAQNAQPKMRGLSTEMRDMQRHAVDTGRALGQMGFAAQQGLAGFPQIAVGLYDAVGGVKGLGEAMKNVTPVARISTQALIGVGIGVVAVGAAVAAYGVSVFRMAKDMDQLNRTARTMGMSFAELKNAQDQAKSFGGSAEMMVRTFQGVQAAQLDLYKTNSALRERLVAKGVSADFVDALGVMNPTEFTNAGVKYAQALEKQWLAAGAMKNVARGQANKFLGELGIDINLMDMPPLEPPTEAAKQAAERLAKLSKDVMDIWNPLSIKLELIKLEALKAGLPYLTSFLTDSDKLIGQIKEGVDAVGRELANVLGLFAAISKPEDNAGWWVDSLIGPRGTTMRDALEQLGAVNWVSGRDNPTVQGGQLHVPESPLAPYRQPGTSAPALPPELMPPSALRPDKAKESIQDKFKGFRGESSGASGGLGIMATQDLTEKTEDNTGQMEKLTAQIEKLNSFYERIEQGRGGGGGGGFGGGGGSGTWGGNYDKPESGGPAGGFRGGRRSGGDNTPAPASGSAGGEDSTVSKADAEQIFSKGNVGGDMPATTTGGGAVPPMGPTPGVTAPFHLGGTLTMEGKTYHYGSGGRGRGSTPPGSYPVNIATPYGGPGQLGDVGRAIGSIATVGGLGGEINDPRYPGAPRSGIQIHPASSSRLDQLFSQGCFAVSAAEWPAFKAHLLDLNKRTPGGLRIDVGKDGRATILARGMVIPQGGNDNVQAARVGGYPTSMLNSRVGSNLGLDASINSRADLQRDALNDNTNIDAKGTVKVQVGGKTAAEREGVKYLFKDSAMTTMEQNPHTGTGGSSVDDVAKQYMANR